MSLSVLYVFSNIRPGIYVSVGNVLEAAESYLEVCELLVTHQLMLSQWEQSLVTGTRRMLLLALEETEENAAHAKHTSKPGETFSILTSRLFPSFNKVPVFLH